MHLTDRPADHDFTGLKCPLPVLKARRAFKQVEVGTQLVIWADDPAAPLDFDHFCQTSGHQMVASESRDGLFIFLIEKR